MRPHLRPATIALFTALAVAGLSLHQPARADESKREATSRIAWLGVTTQSIDDELRDGMDFKGSGVLVNDVVDGSPAERAGLHQGDVIVSFNGESVESPEDLQSLVRNAHPGDHVRIEIQRERQRQTLNATLGERSDVTRVRTRDEDESGDEDNDTPTPDMEKLNKSMEKMNRSMDKAKIDLDLSKIRMDALKNLADMPIPGRGRLGVQLQDLDGDLGSYFSVPQGKGALVVEVEKESPASRAGIKAGDVILKVDDDEVEDSNDAAQAIRQHEGKVNLVIMRRGSRQTLTAELSPRARVQRIVRGHGPMMYEVPMLPEAPVTPEAPRSREVSRLHREMQQLREEIQQLREELQQKSKD